MNVLAKKPVALTASLDPILRGYAAYIKVKDTAKSRKVVIEIGFPSDSNIALDLFKRILTAGQ